MYRLEAFCQEVAERVETAPHQLPPRDILRVLQKQNSVAQLHHPSAMSSQDVIPFMEQNQGKTVNVYQYTPPGFFFTATLERFRADSASIDFDAGDGTFFRFLGEIRLIRLADGAESPSD